MGYTKIGKEMKKWNSVVEANRKVVTYGRLKQIVTPNFLPHFLNPSVLTLSFE